MPPKQPSTRFVTTILLAGALPAPVCGLGIRIADQDPAATARGNAFAATADNPSAIYYNPAGITQLSGHNIRAGIYGITLNSNYEGNGTSFDTRDEILAVPQLYYTYTPDNLPLSFGLGLYSPYGLGLEWPEDSSFRSSAIEGRLTYLSLNPVVAWQVHPTVSIAAGPHVNYSDVKLRQGTPFNVPGDKFEFEGDDVALGFNLGVLWQPHPMHSFGLAYRSATTMDFDGHSEIVIPPAFSSRESARTRDFDIPQHVVVGYSFRPSPRWNLEINVDWTDWDTLDTVTLNQESSADIELPFNWKSSFFYEFGATRYFDNGYHLGAGYIFSENSVPEEYFTPTVPDSDRHIFSLGGGARYDRWHWDAAYQLAYGPERTIDHPNVPPAVQGRYEFISHALTASIGYRF
jgi:long-chain fatty acid transport protein